MSRWQSDSYDETSYETFSQKSTLTEKMNNLELGKTIKIMKNEEKPIQPQTLL